MATQLKEKSSGDTAANGGEAAKPKEKSPSLPKRAWDKLGLNVPILKSMFKGACPPVIALALFQADSFAAIFSTIGYLVAIVSIMSGAAQPRSRFFQTMVFNILGICIGASIALLTCYCTVQARLHTTTTASPTSGGPSPGTRLAAYNSSASAVSAIFLFTNICLSNAIRFSRPQLQVPIIIYSIFANISATYAPQFPTMAISIAFVKKLLEAFLTGFAIAFAVNLFIFPVTARAVVFADFSGYISGLQNSLNGQMRYLQSLEHDLLAPSTTQQGTQNSTEVSKEGEEDSQTDSKKNEAIKNLKAGLAGLGAIYGKSKLDLTFGKREYGWGKLDGDDLNTISDHLKRVLLPLLGMGSLVDIVNRVSEKNKWNEATDDQAEKERIANERKGFGEMIQIIREPFENMSEILQEGLTHASYALELSKKPKEAKVGTSGTEASSDDVEARAGIKSPGDPEFAAYLEAKIAEFLQQRVARLHKWYGSKGIEFPATERDHRSSTGPEAGSTKTMVERRQLYLILYMEFLLIATGRAIVELIKFGDKKVESGVMKKNRFIHPGPHRLRKWIKGALSPHEEALAEGFSPDQSERGASEVYLGDSFHKRKDPEHLPPVNRSERIGDKIRAISHVLASRELAFGFRVACATMSIAIVAYLKDTQEFFVEQRIVWAMIMVAIGMTMTSGSGVFGFLGRVAGTFVATVTSLAIWYIAGGSGSPGGVIALLFVFTFIEGYFMAKFPQFMVIILLSMVTQVLVLGYELQVEKLGIAASESSGQLYYPIYKLAPYRLAIVSAGCLVAFIWTYFPYPLTSRAQIRQSLGKSLYLVANYHSCLNTTVKMRLEGSGGDPEDKHSPGRRLEKAHNKLLSKQSLLIAGIRQESTFSAFEPTFGGKFPKDKYDTIVDEVQSLQHYMALIAYSTEIYAAKPISTKDTSSDSSAPAPVAPARSAWTMSLARLVGSVDIISQQNTSILALLSSSVLTGTPLPPYLKPPPSFHLTENLMAMDNGILGIEHVLEPGFAAFAVTQVASSLINDDMEKLLKNVKSLVGELDFSYHIINSAESSEETLRPEGTKKGKKD